MIKCKICGKRIWFWHRCIYETLRKWTLRKWKIPAGGIGMDILVSEEMTKEEVLALVHRLRLKYLSEKNNVINVFDSMEPYLNRSNPNYSEEEYSKHYLVNFVRNSKIGYDKISWTKENGEIYYRNIDCPNCGRHRIQINGVCEKCLWDVDGKNYASITRPNEYNPQGRITKSEREK